VTDSSEEMSSNWNEANAIKATDRVAGLAPLEGLSTIILYMLCLPTDHSLRFSVGRDSRSRRVSTVHLRIVLTSSKRPSARILLKEVRCCRGRLKCDDKVVDIVFGFADRLSAVVDCEW
jgi:hypothetical protein